MTVVVEMVIFELRPGIGDEAFLQTAAEASAVLKASGGFISRLLSRDGTQWIDIVQWESPEDAARAKADCADRPEVRAFSAAMAEGALSMRHAEPAEQTAH